jgi:UDP-2,3-diacylglucosamine pyrophosphatase LpxH
VIDTLSRENSTASAYVVSDLHMFCKRSEADFHMPAIHKAAEKADYFVLNGDTFDFRWSTLESTEATIREALRWLRELAESHPACHFHFILGNHDCHHAFVRALEKLVEQVANLDWHPYYLRLGDTLFLHGDVATRRMSHACLERSRQSWLHERQRGRTLNLMHDMAFHLNVHKAVSQLAHPTRRVLERVMAYLESIEPHIMDGVAHVYFGHTHVAFTNYAYRGLRFHNGGAPMRNLTFNILRAEINIA